MLGAVLILLVILNSFLTGWLLASFLRTRNVVRQLGREQQALAEDVRDLGARQDAYRLVSPASGAAAVPYPPRVPVGDE